jgi:polar amino acid transport system substrate-binding protein
MIRWVLFMAAATFFGPSVFAEDRNQIAIYLPDAPPLTSSSETAPRYTHDIIKKALEGCGFELTFNYTSWKRAQAYVQNDPAAIIIPLARTPLREPFYRWIVPIVSYQSAFVTVGEPLNALSDITPEMIIATEAGSANWDFLLTEGVNENQLIEMTSSRPLIDMIAVGRLDAWFSGVPEIYHNQSSSYLKPDTVGGTSIYATALYVAASPNCPDALANKVHLCVSKFKETPEYAGLVAPYLASKTISD